MVCNALRRAVKANSARAGTRHFDNSRTVFITALDDEKHSYNLPGWPASQWTDVHVASLHRHRGRELLTLELISLKTRDCQSIAGFLLNPAAGKGGAKERHRT